MRKHGMKRSVEHLCFGTSLLVLSSAMPASSQTEIDGFTVESANAGWLIATPLDIAPSTTGGVTISGGGDLTVNGRLRVAPAIGTRGSLTMTGAGSTATVTGGRFEVGGRGEASLDILDGAQLFVSGLDSMRLAGLPTGETTVTVSGAGSLIDVDSMTMSKLISASPFDTNGGLSSLIISNGGTVDIENGLEFGTDGTATVTITGPGSTLSADEIEVKGDDGRMDILLGGVVTTDTFDIDKTADLRVSGTGSRLNLTGAFNIESDHRGTIEIINGGVLAIADSFYGTPFGALAAGEGEMTISGSGSRLLVTQDMFLEQQAGNLRISDGATVDIDGLFSVNTSNTSTSSVFLSGPGSTLDVGTTLTLGDDRRADLTLSNGASLKVGTETRIAVDPGSTGTLTIGAASGITAVATGTVETPLISFGTGVGRLVLNHANSDYIFDSAMTGAGSLDAHAGNTQLTGDLSGYTGSVTIHGGRLAFNSVSNGTVNVLSGGTLGGAGTVADVTLANGATVAPGNSIGTLNVTGNLDFGGGSTYAVEVDSAGNADRIIATGAITINNGAILSVMPENGTDNGITYLPSTTYTILQGASLTGSFGTITDGFAFLDATASYDATRAYLTLARNGSAFSALAQTPNQTAVAGALTSLGSGTLYNAILGLPGAEPPQAFAALSGEIHATLASGMLDNGMLVTATLADRMNAAEAADLQLITARSTDIWMATVGQLDHLDADGNGHAGTATNGGIVFGADRSLDDGWRLGLAAGYTLGRLSQDTLGSTADTDSHHLAAYGGRELGPFSLSFGATQAWTDVETTRNVRFTGYSDTLTADYKARITEAFVEAGFEIEQEGWQVQPFNRLTFTHVSSQGLRESGGSATLTVADNTEHRWANMLGLRISHDISMGGMQGSLRGSLGWRHILGDTTTATTMRFATGDAFTVSSAEIARDSALLSLGANLNLTENARLDLDYAATLSPQSHAHNLTARLTMKF